MNDKNDSIVLDELLYRERYSIERTNAVDGQMNYFESIYNAQKLGIMELHRFFRYAIEKMCKEKKSLNHFNNKNSS